ncbi:MAG: hypothetical protein ACPGVU_01975 [Limisphaerales bacterium]
MRLGLGILILLCALRIEAAYPPFRTGLSDLRFTVSSPLSTTESIKDRVGRTPRRSTYNPTRELYRVIVPPNYTPSKSWGLIVWVDPFDAPRIPSGWPALLAEKGYLIVLPANAGNRRNSTDRIRLALDARHHMPRLFNIDTRRIIISGWNEGGRIASVVGVAYPDQFPNCIPMMGCFFYDQIPLGRNRFYPVAYTPKASMVDKAKNNRFIIVTTPGDVLGQECKLCYEHGFKAKGFRDVRLVTLPTSMAMPQARLFRKVLNQFDTAPQ